MRECDRETDRQTDGQACSKEPLDSAMQLNVTLHTIFKIFYSGIQTPAFLRYWRDGDVKLRLCLRDVRKRRVFYVLPRSVDVFRLTGYY